MTHNSSIGKHCICSVTKNNHYRDICSLVAPTFSDTVLTRRRRGHGTPQRHLKGVELADRPIICTEIVLDVRGKTEAHEYAV